MKKHVSVLLGLLVIFSSLFTSCNEEELDPNICKITVKSEGNGTVSITDYIGTSVNVLIGNRVEVEATPDESWAFIGWYVSGSESPVSTDAAFTFITSENITLTARFAKLSDIIIRSGGNGSVAFKNASGNSIPVLPGAEVTVIATPNEDCDFVGWFIGDSETPVSTEAVYTFTATENIVLTGQFSKRPVVTVQSAGNGSVSIKDTYWTNKAFLPGTEVTVIAKPYENCDFIGWFVANEESPISTDAEYTFNVTEDIVLTAKFEKLPVITIFSIGNGDVAFEEHLGTSIAVLPNTEVRVIATPDDNCDFLGWFIDNELVSTELTFVINVNNDVVLIAKFTEINLLENFSFEIWEGEKLTGWGQTVTNATYRQSSDAYSGNSSVLIEGNSSSNKRFASKRYILEAGTYTLSAYMKQNGETTGQARIGYAKLTNGVVADTQNDYIYLTSASAVSSTWKQTTSNFTLTEQTEIAVIIMDSKYGSGASILVDDVTLTTRDGGIIEGSGNEEPETPAGTYISEAFTNGFGSFTTQETVGSYPWVSDAQYGAKASGYADGASQDAESWLISPAINFASETAAYIAFDYVINKGDASAAAANHKLLIASNYTGDVATTEWTEINYGAVNNNSWSFQNTGNIALPESMMGKDAVVFAFKYMSTTANSSTWEIKNVVVSSGTGTTPETPEEPETPDTPDTPDTPAAEAGVFDFTNPEGLTPSVERATVAAGSTQGAGVEASEYTFTNGGVTVKVSQGSASTPVRFWTKTGGDVELRTYKNSTITISVNEGTMSSIVFEGGKVSTMSANTGSFSNGTWSGNAQSVTFNVTGTLNIQKLTVK